jgi:DNA-binding NarL/FixJ family response regulator
MASGRGRSLIRVLVVDDHPSVRFGLCSLLNSESDFEVCGEAENTQQAFSQFKEKRPDVVIVDISLQGESGLDLIERLKTEDPRVKCLVVSLLDEMIYAERAFQVGAVGYVSKSESLTEIIEAVRRVAGGHTRVSPDVSDHLFRKLAGMGFSEPPSSPVAGLTDRELQVFELVGRGLETRDIAGSLKLSPKTVSTYYENIKRKLDLPNKTELVRHAVTWLMERE